MSYSFEHVKILVVEDNQPMQDIVRSLLTAFGVGTIIAAKNGEEGLKMLKKHDPDLVIADWLMKPIDGISFTQYLRRDMNVPNPYVPVILMTGFSEKRRVLQARDAGVTEFLVKPFNAHDLYKRMVQIIERPRQFVKSEHFFGPDRRRTKGDGYVGPLRRFDDKQNADYVKSRIRAAELMHDIRTRSMSTTHKPSDIEMVEHSDA